MAIPVNVFNANQYPLNVMVNRGSQVSVAAVTPTTWVPGTTAAGTGPGWDNGGTSPGNFGPGSNTVQVQLGTGTFKSLTIDLPDQNPSSVQVYFFFPPSTNSKDGSVGSVAWYALYGGMVVAAGVSN